MIDRDAMHIGYGYGRIIRSDIPVPGCGPVGMAGADAHRPDLAIRCTPATTAVRPGLPDWQRIEDGLIYSVPAIGSFTCRPRALGIAPAPGADMARLQAIMVATMLPTLLWLDGALLLHAAAVDLDGSGRVVAIAGRSGVGKSTVAAQLIAAGARLVADDSLALTITDDVISAHGLPGGQYRVTDGAGNRTFAPLPDAAMAPGGRLAAILLLEEAADDCIRLDPVTAAAAVHAQRHRPQVPRILGTTASALALSAHVAGAVPVYRWPRPRGSARLTIHEVATMRHIAGQGQNR